jgi:hypothetical protein
MPPPLLLAGMELSASRQKWALVRRAQVKFRIVKVWLATMNLWSIRQAILVFV